LVAVSLIALAVLYGVGRSTAASATPVLVTTPPSAQPSPAVPIVVPSLGGEAWTPERIAALQHDLDAMLDGATTIRGAHVGVLAIDTRTAVPIYLRNADDAFQPASTLKLVVGSAALDKLGTAFRFTTQGYASAAGRAILLLAGGDPFLTTADLGGFAEAVAKLGVPRLALAVDASRYDSQAHALGWTWDDFAYSYAAPISAIALNENAVTIEVRPGARPGERARVSFASIDPLVLDGAVTLKPGSESTLDVSHAAHFIVLSGGIAADSAPENIDAAVPDASSYAYEVASQLLQERHVLVSQAGAADAPLSGARLVWSHDSPPLAQFLGPRFWIPSDNLVAELMLNELGYATGGAPGTTEKGVAFEKTWLEAIGVDPATTTLADGSGMSQYDRITPRDLVAVLQHDWNGPYRDLVLNSLPVGAARGTIEGIAGTPAAGRVFAKTGSMMHIRGLAGYLATEHHGAVTFVFTVDDWLGDYPALAALRASLLSRIVQD
jgi:D-alanyl-D-alanine carboxypeptidase/D-alanyl-D-alanine-endopeptidase (penicillin-binding protein 4)